MVLITSTNGTSSSRRPEQVRPQVQHRADQQPSGAAAFDRQPSGRVYFSLDQVSAASTKSENVFFLCISLPCVVPLLAHLAAAAHVGDGVRHTPVQQAQPGAQNLAGSPYP